MTYAVGSLVKARGREWVVLPESEAELLVLRPLGGTEDEVAGIYLPLERVEAAQFALPDPGRPGDYRSSRLLRDAVRLGFRSSAGPFRSFARIAVEPRPYQLVPLLMALKLDPVRILIADDGGIGKTVEAALVARELIDRGEAERLAVLCPPHLAEQWGRELQEKFGIEAELVLPGTATRLERNLGMGESLFDHYPYVVVSLDFIKQDRRRDEFLRTCPELVIVDEAHTCAATVELRGARHQRHQLVEGLAKDRKRHLILVTATPHSGKEDAFRSLLALLNPEFAALPEDLTGREHEQQRRRLAAHLVQRRRGDIRHYLQAETPFPEREEMKPEPTYKLSPEYRAFFDRVLRYARESVLDSTGGHFRQRVRWWSALALLRSIASSPAAAAATLRSRAATADAATEAEVDEIGRHIVLDQTDDETAEGADVTPGSDASEREEGGGQSQNHRRLLEMAREADALAGAKDEKLQQAIMHVAALVKDGYRPILFCRFIPTAEYVAAALRERLPKDVEVQAVTGLLPPDEREQRVLRLAQQPRHVLVATDCLSEGINLQEHFDAVMHYDLSWNPTRHEQREGRVDRYGQPSVKVRVLTYYGTDNPIDGIVLDVLLRKHQTIRSSLGISVPVPVDTDQVVEAIFEGLLLRQDAETPQGVLPGFQAYIKPHKDELFRVWDAATEKERRSRTVFAQESIHVDEVSRELEAVRASIGAGTDVAGFVRAALSAHGAGIGGDGILQADLRETPRALREAMGNRDAVVGRFELPVQEGELYLSRTHPVVEGLASYVLDTALDPLGNGIARRCSVIRTSRVERRTTILLLRLRYHILSQQGDRERALLAEDVQVVGFAGSLEHAEWLQQAALEQLLLARPEANVSPDQAANFVRAVVGGFDAIRPHLDTVTREQGGALLEAHRRVRGAARMRTSGTRVEPHLPPDVLGIYLFLPV
ncbi:MAG: helicase-related protein [Dehalococcoidia bacterium]